MNESLFQTTQIYRKKERKTTKLQQKTSKN